MKGEWKKRKKEERVKENNKEKRQKEGSKEERERGREGLLSHLNYV